MNLAARYFLLCVIACCVHSDVASQHTRFSDAKLKTIKNRLDQLRDIANGQKKEGDFNGMLQSYREMDSLARKTRDTLFMIRSLQGLANVYRYKDDYTRSLDYYIQTIKLAEQTGEKEQHAVALANIALIYGYLKRVDEECKSLEASARLCEELGDTLMMISTYNNLGNSNLNAGNNEEAQRACMRAKELAEQYGISRVGDTYVSEIYRNLGRLMARNGQLNESIINYKRALDCITRTGSKKNIARVWGDLAKIYLKAHDYHQAQQSATMLLELSKDLTHKRGMMKAYGYLSEALYHQSNYKKAYEYQAQYGALKDSLLDEENLRQMNEMHEKYETGRKEQQIVLLRREKQAEKKLADSNSRRKNAILAAVIIGLSLAALLLWQTFRSLRISKQQKKLIEEKQTDIIDSITYAKRLQQAILATPSEIKEKLNDFFLLYKPKDIVAGDFYFFETTGTHIFIAAADCTGHGVPGAMVSMVCSNALTRCVREFGLSDPGKILDKTSQLVTETFEKSGADVKDGMDISLCSISFQTPDSKFQEGSYMELGTVKPGTAATLLWAGAHNALWYTNNGQMRQLVATKKHVGKSENNISFKTHTVALKKNDMVFLFTDGFSDQFGGRDGKKFKSGNLSAFLMEGAHLSMLEQQTRLEKCFNDWKGDLEQVDDVCIIGLRIS